VPGSKGAIALCSFNNDTKVRKLNISFLLFSGNKIKPKITQKKGIDLLGIFLSIVVLLFAFYPLFLVGFIVWFELDAYSSLDRYLLSAGLSWRKSFENGNWGLALVLYTAKFILALGPVHQICRTLSMIICFTTMLAHLTLACIEILSHNSRTIASISYARLNAYLANYHALEIILLTAYDYIGNVIGSLMLIGFFLAVVFNFASLKMYPVIPMPLYLYFPSVSVLIPFTIHFMLKMGIDYHGNTENMVAIKWNRVVGQSCDRKYARRRIRATRILRVHGSILGFKIYDLTKSVRVEFYKAIQDYTINALLSIDTSHMKRFEI
jgi:hypothetical protein